ncbi:hypothetical protein V8C86DRAFT_2762752 [Haematococcus lacustris]
MASMVGVPLACTGPLTCTLIGVSLILLASCGSSSSSVSTSPQHATNQFEMKPHTTRHAHGLHMPWQKDNNISQLLTCGACSTMSCTSGSHATWAPQMSLTAKATTMQAQMSCIGTYHKSVGFA